MKVVFHDIYWIQKPFREMLIKLETVEVLIMQGRCNSSEYFLLCTSNEYYEFSFYTFTVYWNEKMSSDLECLAYLPPHPCF